MANKYITLTNLETFLGQLETKYKATASTYGGVKIDTNAITGTKNYPVALNTNGVAYVNVPWEAGSSYTLNAATSSELGGIKIGYYSGNIKIDTSTNTMYTPVLLDDTNKAYTKISAVNANNPGLMLADDKSKLDTISDWYSNPDNYTYKLPNATSSIKGGVTIGSNITVSSGKISISKKNITDALGYTPPESAGTSGGGMVSITYADLKDARDGKDGKKLVPGTKYRIIDYKTTVNTSVGSYSVLGQQFDIIVEALSECELSENAKACWHYSNSSSSFTNYHFSNSDLTAWELKYCIDNDDNKFEWANKTSGTGVIYYMKDEWGNEAPYDFKNIRFVKNGLNWYTFSKLAKNSSSGYSVYDASTIYNGDTHTSETMPFATHNVIKPCYNSEYPRYTSANTAGNKTKLRLNQIVCVYAQNLSFNDANHIVYNNYFDTNCYNIWILGAPYENKFGKNCRDIEIGGPTPSYNNFGNNCTNIKLATFDYTSTGRNSHSVGSGSAATTHSHYIEHNNFGNNCSNIILGESCSFNVFGNNCGGWEAGICFIGNKIGDNCCAWKFGNHCSKNVMIDNNYTTKYGNGDYLMDKFIPDFNDYTYASITASGSIADWVCDCYFGEQSHAQITLCTSNGYNYSIDKNFDKDNVLRFVRFTNLTGKEYIDSTTAPPDIKILGGDNSDYGGWNNLQVMRLATYNEDASNGAKYELTRYRLDY